MTAFLSDLAKWQQNRRDHTLTDKLRYRISWKPLPSPAAGAPTGKWLMVIPEAPTHPEWIAATDNALTAAGATVEHLVLGPADLSRAELAERLRQMLSPHAQDGAESGEPGGVLSWLGMDQSAHHEHPAISNGLAATLVLAQALHDAGSHARLWILTCGAVSVGRSDPVAAPGQNQVWGLARSIGLEMPHLWGGLIDLPPVADPRLDRHLLTALAGSEEDQLAIRTFGTYVRRLVPAPHSRTPATTWTPRDTAVITGGTGGIGAQLARWLATNGTSHLVLVNRSGHTPRAKALTAELEQLGATVTVTACDITDHAALSNLLEQIPHPAPTHPHPDPRRRNQPHHRRDRTQHR